MLWHRSSRAPTLRRRFALCATRPNENASVGRTGMPRIGRQWPTPSGRYGATWHGRPAGDAASPPSSPPCSAAAEHAIPVRRVQSLAVSIARHSAFVIDVRDLERHPGQTLRRTLEAPAAARLGEGLVGVTAGTAVHAEVMLESLHDGILLTGTVTTRADGVCSRCLRDLELPVEVEIQELFAYSSDEASEYEVHGGEIDCEPLLRDTVVLSLPFQPICRPDCPGLDPETGMLRAHPARPEESAADPRWSVLAGFQVSEDSGDEPAEHEE